MCVCVCLKSNNIMLYHACGHITPFCSVWYNVFQYYEFTYFGLRIKRVMRNIACRNLRLYISGRAYLKPVVEMRGGGQGG